MLVARNGFEVGDRLRLPDHEGEFEVVEVFEKMMRVQPVKRRRLGMR